LKTKLPVADARETRSLAHLNCYGRALDSVTEMFDCDDV
jgi:hypothetical protein